MCWVSHSRGTSLERENRRRSFTDDEVMDTCLAGQEMGCWRWVYQSSSSSRNYSVLFTLYRLIDVLLSYNSHNTPQAKSSPYVLGTSYSSILTNLSSQTTSCPAQAPSLLREILIVRPLHGRINSIILTLRKPILRTSIMRQHSIERRGLIIFCTGTSLLCLRLEFHLSFVKDPDSKIGNAR